MDFGLVLPANNFYALFGTSINQDNQFQSIPPCFMASYVGRFSS